MNPSVSSYELSYLLCLASFAGTFVCLAAGALSRLSVRARQRFAQLAFSVALTAIVVVSLAKVSAA